MSPDYVEAVRAEMAQLTFEVCCPPQRCEDPFAPVLVTVVRNEARQLPGLLDHYRRRGIQEFIFIDNGSTDHSVAWLESQPDTCVIEVDRPFSWQAKQAWIMRVIDMIDYHRWFLVVDADERVVFPGDHHHTFSDLTADMTREGVWRIRGMLVDMYGPGPLLETPDVPPETAQRLYDGEGYETHKTWEMVSVKGGPRRRAFATDAFDIDPELTKYPLFRLAPGELMANPHHHWPYDENFKSQCHLGILHYKFGPELADKILTAIKAGNYWNQSIEYRAYQAALKANPKLSLQYPGSNTYGAPADLVNAGLIDEIDWKKWRWQRIRRKLGDRYARTVARIR